MFRKYGVEYSTQCPKIQEKIKETTKERYGVEYASQCPEFQEKCKQTCIEKYGVEYSFQAEEVKDKIKETCIERYGVEYAIQNPDILEYCQSKSFKRKTYIMPSKNVITYQGYENFALDELLFEEQLDETDIITGCKNVPEIWYYDENNKKHRHYVDIFIPSQNKCIEVKSIWTLEKKQDCIILKQEAGKDLGYNYEIWVYNAKGEKVECYT